MAPGRFAGFLGAREASCFVFAELHTVLESCAKVLSVEDPILSQLGGALLQVALYEAVGTGESGEETYERTRHVCGEVAADISSTVVLPPYCKPELALSASVLDSFFAYTDNWAEKVNIDAPQNAAVRDVAHRLRVARDKVRQEFDTAMPVVVEAVESILEADRRVNHNKARPNVQLIHDRVNQGMWVKLPPKVAKADLMKTLEQQGEAAVFRLWF